MTIKHLVISGGGQTMLQALGVLQHLEINKIFERINIQSIYGTSAGAIVAILFAFRFDWETINDFMIKRPWHELFPIKIQSIFDAYTNKGIYTENVFEKFLKPLLDAKDLSLKITLKEFFNYSNIELHLFTFEINEFKVEDISYLTHPDLSLICAMQMTCAIPVLISPVCLENKCYIDGGMVTNYPLNYCIEKYKNEEEILGIKNTYVKKENSNIDDNSNLLDFVMNFLFKIIYSFSTTNKQPKIENEVICSASIMTISILKTAIYSMDVRKELLESGIETAKEYIKNKELT
jgi:predicted acylesterase/phospholipase RssA